MTDSTDNNKTEITPIRTLAFEYAKAPNYVCVVCHKHILSKSLCISTIERTNKKQKKRFVKPSNTTHFKCWTVPEEFRTHPKPLEVYRGFVGLKPSDKNKIERMKEAGAGTTWAALMAADEAEQQEKQQQEEEAQDDDKKKPESTKRKHKDNNDEDKDMTQALTGGQANKKKAKTAKSDIAIPIKKDEKESNKKKKAPKQLDKIHGEGFEEDLNNILNDFK
ncbi:hypothetical protein BC941DRAFT_469666 [Chlamydoabsidia padenii]|nr:hypothetical protein BC941DRAFT_469666 [Chlamydoabsidia padenii]